MKFKETMPFIAIMLIVAIVGLVVLLTGKDTYNSEAYTVELPETQDSYDAPMAGQALVQRNVLDYTFECHGGMLGTTKKLGCVSIDRHVHMVHSICEKQCTDAGQCGTLSLSAGTNC